jgi:hypothetical protein
MCAHPTKKHMGQPMCWSISWQQVGWVLTDVFCYDVSCSREKVVFFFGRLKVGVCMAALCRDGVYAVCLCLCYAVMQRQSTSVCVGVLLLLLLSLQVRLEVWWSARV